MATRTPVAVIGASGYVGAELVRLLVRHPHIALRGLYAHRRAGEEVAKDFPQFAGILQARYEPYDAAAVAASGCEIAFLALPHGESARAAKELYERGLTVLDLSADLRLSAELYGQWYKPHVAPEILPHAVYGLVERHREALRQARLVAVPGCYPTASILALAPLLAARLVRADGLIVDAKSGVSGAGREAQRSTHFAEIGEGVRAYKVAGTHRHTPEIEQELERAGGEPVRLVFTPHLIPMTRGILATAYALPTDPSRPAAAYADELRRAYAKEPFVAVVDHPPDTVHVRGSNRVQVAAWLDERAGRVVAMGVIDNLVKGAAGQAVQCLNVMRGWDETTGLDGAGIFP